VFAPEGFCSAGDAAAASGPGSVENGVNWSSLTEQISVLGDVFPELLDPPSFCGGRPRDSSTS